MFVNFLVCLLILLTESFRAQIFFEDLVLLAYFVVMILTASCFVYGFFLSRHLYGISSQDVCLYNCILAVSEK